MPYFPAEDIIFIHIPKCAGTYVERVLGVPDEWGLFEKPATVKNRLRSGVTKLIKRFFLSQDDILESIEKRRMLFGNSMKGYTLQHATLEEVISLRLLPLDIVHNSIVFSVHRHPIDRVYSVFNYWEFFKVMSFDRFCEDVVEKPWLRGDLTHTQLTHLRPQVDFLKVNGQIPAWVKLVPIDQLGSFLSNLEFKEKRKNCLDVAKINASGVEPIDHKILSPRTVEIIQSRYNSDYNLLGYQLT